MYFNTLHHKIKSFFSFELCAVTVKALGSLHCMEVVFSFGIDRSFSFSPKMRKTLQPVHLLIKDMLAGDSCYGQYQITCHSQLPSLPLHCSFAPPCTLPHPSSSPPYVHSLPSSCAQHLFRHFSGQYNLVLRHLVYEANDCWKRFHWWNTAGRRIYPG